MIHRIQHKYLYALAALLIFGGLSSCRPEAREGSSPSSGNGPVTVPVQFFTPSFAEHDALRAAVSATAEKMVWNVCLFVFDESGKKVHAQFYPLSELSPKDHRQGVLPKNDHITLPQRGKYKFYAVANIQEGDQGSWVVATPRTVENPTPKTGPTGVTLERMEPTLPSTVGTSSAFNGAGILAKVQTEDDLKKLAVSFREGMETPFRQQGRLLMSGMKEADVQGTDPQGIVIPLERMASRIEFTIQTGKLVWDESNQRHVHTPNPKVKFFPESWQVINLPKRSYVVGHTYDEGKLFDASQGRDDVFSTGEFLFEGEKGDGFAFYQFECVKPRRAKIEVTRDAMEQYKQRAKRLKNPDTYGGPLGSIAKPWGPNSTQNGEFLYAPTLVTYVKIKGRVEVQNGGESAVADVEYTVPLGYVHELLNTAHDLVNRRNFYDVLRNNIYKYHLYVNGVDEIVLEAERVPAGNRTPGQVGSLPHGTPEYLDGETNPGVEGRVSKTNIAYLLDSHYNTFVIKVPAGTITSSNVNDMVRAWTPYTQKHGDETGIKYLGTKKGKHLYGDTEWVRFAWNGPPNPPSRHSPQPTNGTGKPTKPTVFNWARYVYIGYSSSDLNKSARNGGLMDVSTFLKHAHANNSMDQCYTVYVDENYYYQDPYENLESTSNLAHYVDFVNQPPRTLQIFGKQPIKSVSADGNSVVNYIAVEIAQRSIEVASAFKNRNLQSFGVESFNETGPLKSAIINGIDRSSDYGWSSYEEYLPRYNFTLLAGLNNSLTWDGFIYDDGNRNARDIIKDGNVMASPEFDSTGKYTGFGQNRSFAEYACAQRNFDVDGNGLISTPELRWYLPTVEQMEALWVASPALFPDTRVWNDNIKKLTSTEQFYLTSSRTKDDKDLYVVSSRTGAVAGTLRGVLKKAEARISYRCVRGLYPKVYLGGHNIKTALKRENEDYLFWPSNAVEDDDNRMYKVGKDIQPSIGSYRDGVITLDNLNEKAVRQPYEFIATGEIATHRHLDQPNMPYSKFRVAKTDAPLPAGGLFADHASKDQSLVKRLRLGESPCAGVIDGEWGWRLPTQKELLLMRRFVWGNTVPGDIKNPGGNYVSCSYHEDSPHFFYLNSSANGYLDYIGSNTYGGNPVNQVSLKVRCVKDVR